MIINQDDGHIRVHRRLYSHPAFRSWQEATIFAWMIAAAQWRDVVEQTPLGFVTLLRGQFAASERDLAEHCGIPKTTLRRLLARLRQAGMISCGRPPCPWTATGPRPDRDRTTSGPRVDHLHHRKL